MSEGVPTRFEVELPSGGKLQLYSAEEVKIWQDAEKRYKEEYAFIKMNDLIMLGAILTQQLTLFRAQQKMNGMEPVLDTNNVPTGQYKVVQMKASEMKAAQDTLLKASKEIRDLESQLGIDKKSREQGGQQSVSQYVTFAKRAANEYGIHISKRVTEYERVFNAVRTKIRVLDNADDEDRAYEGISEASILDYLRTECARLEQVDKDFAADKGKLFVGRL